jgi:aspartyl/asparaginyl-tRNA synthetase
MHPFIDPVDAKEFSHAVRLLREFFAGRGFVEAAVQHRLSILSACEDPFNVATFDYAGEVWPLPQTGQMWLEQELLRNPNVYGFFCVTTSYRQEPDPQEGRHNLIFPMFEFEMHGNMDALYKLEVDLLRHVGFKNYPWPPRMYDETAEEYGVKELTGEHEAKINEEYGPVFFLEYFPEYTSPFWLRRKQASLKLLPELRERRRICAVHAHAVGQFLAREGFTGNQLALEHRPRRLGGIGAGALAGTDARAQRRLRGVYVENHEWRM